MPDRLDLSPPAPGSGHHRGGGGTSQRSGVVAVGLGLALALVGCAGALDVEAAPQATDPGCSALIEALPATVAGAARRGTGDTPGVAAWGDPAVVLRCGTDPTDPTSDPCLNAEGVDWVERAAGADGASLLAAYGRVPGVQVEIPAGPAPSEVLIDLAAAVATVAQERTCV